MALPTLNGLALCAGAGGLELALHIAEPNYRTVCYVEWEAYAAANLVARMEDQTLDQAPVWDNVKTFRGKPWRGVVDILTAGYPCQPFSAAGKRKGTADPRHLWPHIAKVIEGTRPQSIFLENVPNHINLGFPVVADDLRRLGYRFEAGLFSARGAGGSHFRRRLFVLAHAIDDLPRDVAGNNNRRRRNPVFVGSRRLSGRPRSGGRRLDAHIRVDHHDRRPQGAGGRNRALPLFAPSPADFKAWHKIISTQPDLKPAICRDDAGLAYRMDRHRIIGNGVCPLVAALAYRTLRAAIEE